MLKQFLVTATRNFFNNKTYSMLNVLGLAIGFACFAFISLWVNDELSVDKFNKNSHRIFRVTGEVITQAESFKQAVTSVPMAAALKQEFPEVEKTVRLDRSDAIVRKDNLQFSEDGIMATDPSFFEVFSYPLLKGNPKTALADAYSIILTESMASKYFGNMDPVGKSIDLFLYDPLGDGATYNVTGVIPDAPKNAHFTFNFLISFRTIEVANPNSVTPRGFGNNSYYTYILLHEAKDKEKVEKALPDFLVKYNPYNTNSPGNQFLLALQPLEKIYLHSDLRYEVGTIGNMNLIYIFVTIGLFILLIAGINYMNLATARSLHRAKEVGVKKVLGASKAQLISQHITESILIAFIAFLLSIIFVVLLNPIFEGLSGKSLSLFNTPKIGVIMFLIMLLIGFLSGIYPALFITSLKAGDVLKGSFKSSNRGNTLRKGLVITQFAIAVVLISGILIINNQLEFMQFKDLGFTKEGLIALKVNGSSKVIQNYNGFKNSLLSTSSTSEVARSNSMIIGGGVGNSGARTIDGEGNPLNTGTYRLSVDPNYLDAYGITLSEGRNFHQNLPYDSSAYIVNEAAVTAFGWKDAADAINKPFEMGGNEGQVIGIVKNFHFDNLQHPIDPIVIVPFRNNFSQITLKTDLSDPKQTIAEISSLWDQHFPGVLMELSFVDQRLNDQYQSEEKFSKFFLYFSILALFIACLGLFGLTAFATRQRIKEIGIRKVLGASVANIATMLSIDFLKLIVLAVLVAFPIAWLVMNNWLQDFAYRVNVSWWNFALAGMIAILIAFITISFQSIKAALSNPIKSLRTE